VAKEILLMAEILHQLIGSLSHYLQGVIYTRWCRISSINSTTDLPMRIIRVFPKIGVPQNEWFMMENPLKVDDLEVPLFLETPITTFDLLRLTWRKAESRAFSTIFNQLLCTRLRQQALVLSVHCLCWQEKPLYWTSKLECGFGIKCMYLAKL